MNAIPVHPSLLAHLSHPSRVIDTLRTLARRPVPPAGIGLDAERETAVQAQKLAAQVPNRRTRRALAKRAR